MRTLATLFALALLIGGARGEDNADEGKEQPKLPKAEAFRLKDYNGKEHQLSDYAGKWVVLEWINHGCPYVKKQYGAGYMQRIQKKYRDKGVIWLSICSSAPGKQGHYTADQWKELDKEKKGAADAVLLDADGTVGKKYGAKTTPHMFVITPKGEIFYDGAIDDTPRAKDLAEMEEARNYVAEALDAGLAGKQPEVRQTRSYG